MDGLKSLVLLLLQSVMRYKCATQPVLNGNSTACYKMFQNPFDVLSAYLSNDKKMDDAKGNECRQQQKRMLIC